ncbi:unnamed protein product [Trifolium pratense]|uniref:Uncharacterized protein n=1 Tax=Trifolium pratense TaxID=57577 RepID=A0ACB0JUE4_TRIPR|nr:unnamed protein product [Trifolium pratense]
MRLRSTQKLCGDFIVQRSAFKESQRLGEEVHYQPKRLPVHPVQLCGVKLLRERSKTSNKPDEIIGRQQPLEPVGNQQPKGAVEKQHLVSTIHATLLTSTPFLRVYHPSKYFRNCEEIDS